MDEKVTFKDMVTQIPIRLAELLVKLLSFKGVVLGISTYLALDTEVLSGWQLFAIYVIVIFGREALKYLDKIKGL